LSSASKLCTPVGEKERGYEVSTTMARTSSSPLYCRRGGVWWLVTIGHAKSLPAPAREAESLLLPAVVPLFCKIKDTSFQLHHAHKHTQGLGHACITLLVRSPVSLAASSQDPSSTDFLTPPSLPPHTISDLQPTPLRDVSVPFACPRVPPPPPLPTPSVFPFTFLHVASS